VTRPRDTDRIREARRRSFDEFADEYDAVRPGYPARLFDELESRVPPPADVLEVGAGTGQATSDLLARGYRVLAVEPGARLAAVLERKLAGSALSIHVGPLEGWPATIGAFDLAAAFSSFHWVDRDTGYRILARALRPGGWLALAWNAPAEADPKPGSFEHAVQPIYRRCAPMLALDAPRDPAGRPGDDHDRRAEIAETRLFTDPVERLTYPWSRRLDTRTYLRLLDTYSGHHQLEPDQRRCLHEGIATLLHERFGGVLVEERIAVLYLARRLD
jgi:SAM-dependent methyltransferase